MASLTLRSAVGRPLTNSEVDANFSALNLELGQKLVASLNLLDLPNPAQARSNLGLGNVENKSSATIRGELTSGNVTGALGYTPLHPGNYTSYAAQGVGQAGGVDLNTVTTSGMYRIESTEANRPGNFGQLLVIHGHGDTITQIYGQYDSGNLYTRSGNPSSVGGSGSWTTWRTILDSNNYGSFDGHLREGPLAGTNIDWNNLPSNIIYQINAESFGNGNGPNQKSYPYGALLSLRASAAQAQIYISHQGNDMIFRGGWGANTGWTTWNKVLTDQNYSAYAMPLSGGTLTGDLIINHSSASIKAGMWDGANVRVESVGRPLYVVSYGGDISIGRSSGSPFVIGNTGVSFGGSQVLHASNFASYALPLSGGTISGRTRINGSGFTSGSGLLLNNNSGYSRVAPEMYSLPIYTYYNGSTYYNKQVKIGTFIRNGSTSLIHGRLVRHGDLNYAGQVIVCEFFAHLWGNQDANFCFFGAELGGMAAPTFATDASGNLYYQDNMLWEQQTYLYIYDMYNFTFAIQEQDWNQSLPWRGVTANSSLQYEVSLGT